MEDSKYYTPSIDEFFVGFEYDCILPQWEIQDWRSTVVGTNEDLDAVYQCIKLGRIRVKYLDKSDIESCGFKQVIEPWMDGRRHMYFKCTIPNVFDGDEDYLLYNIFTKELSIGSLISYEEYYRVSDIIIKNINELRKLLKQLGIE